ncbi:MAG: NUDIX domain-containing protein [Anaerolineaceae bacterium]
MPIIRAIARVIIRRGNTVLIAEHTTHGRISYRPVGGGIKPGERAIEAARREILEELGIAPQQFRLLGVLENIFTIEGKLGHEVVFTFEADWPTEVECGEVVMGEESDGSHFECRWHRITDLAEFAHPLYPEGLLELLTRSG